MPAREETWRSQYWLHIVFAVTSVAMLVGIVWMMAEDHLREWKAYQREFFSLREEQNEEKIKAARTEDFVQQREQLQAQIEEAEATLAERRADLSEKQATLDERSVTVDRLDQAYRFARADRDVARANYGIAVRDAKPEEVLAELEAEVEKQESRVSELQLELEQAQAELEMANQDLGALTAQREALEEDYAELIRDIENLEAAYDQQRLSLGKRILTLPVLDAFNSPLKINQIWLPELKIDYGGMANVARFDRCTTCHLAIDLSTTEGGPAYPVEKYAQPFVTHPRLDLFVGATSPHPMADFGCTICHQGQGSSTSFVYASHTPNTPKQGEVWEEEHAWHAIHFWDEPQFPERFVESGCVKCHHEVVELGASREFGNAAPKLIEGYNLVREYGCFGCHEINGFDGSDRIGPDLRLEPNDSAVAAVMGAYPTEESGIMRKVGPSLSHVASKVTKEWAFHWTREPKSFRPTTRMPQFFGNTNQQDEIAEKFMPVEVRGIVEYLFAKSQPLEVDEIEGSGDAERGKSLFEQRGCLACHTHEAFPDYTNTFGPNLTKIKQKLKGGQEGLAWLVTWLRDPNRHFPRTRMPDVQLEPDTDADGSSFDPAVDIATWLLSAGEDGDYALPDVDEELLNERAFLFLHNTMSTAEANALLENGMPEEAAEGVRGDERELTAPMSTEKKLMYVGRRMISIYGCYGCHDIPGFEEAKPIGTQLADWGRKDPEKLAFEHIVEYLEEHDHAHERAEESGDYAFYLNEIIHHRRPGFAWQKLRAPRSYDYEKLGVKGYDERLRMPHFTFSPDEEENLEKIEAVVTFLLSLVASPPAEQYVYSPDETNLNRIHGERLLTKFNCASCHMLEMAQFTFKADPEEYPAPSHDSDYPFVVEHFAAQVAGQDEAPTADGVARVHGMLTGTDEGPDLSRREDAFEYYIDLWKPTTIAGNLFLPGDRVLIEKDDLQAELQGVGGGFAQQLVQAQIRDNPQLQPSLAWQRVPPPLHLEGEKVQTPWLFQFLRYPFEIRPITLLRMPQFNMSDAEARVLANYFAAKDQADYPYQEVPQQTRQFIEQREQERPEYWSDAWELLTSRRQACVNCHAVAGGEASGDPNNPATIIGPNLAGVNDRLRPDWVLRLLANPIRLIPYTSMPQNFPPNQEGGVPAEIFPGTSADHIRAVRDVLMSYDRMLETEFSKTEAQTATTGTGGGE